MDNLETITTRRSALGTIGKGLLALGLVAYLSITGACGGKKPDNPIVYEQLSAAFAQPSYTTIDNASAGNVPSARIRLIGNGKDVTVNPNERADLGQLEKGKTTNVDITITGSNAYTAKFKYAMRGNMTFGAADLADTRVVNPAMLTRITPTTTNVRYDRTDLNLSFNPDPNGGARLTDSYINAILSGYNAIKARARGKMSTINIDRLGNQAYAQPANGEGRVFRKSDGNGVNTAEYTSGGAVVSFVFNCDPGSATPEEAREETLDNMLGGNVSVTIESVENEIEYRFARSLSDAFYSDYEERANYPGAVSSSQGAQTAGYDESSDAGNILGMSGMGSSDERRTFNDMPGPRGFERKMIEKEQRREDNRRFLDKKYK